MQQAMRTIIIPDVPVTPDILRGIIDTEESRLDRISSRLEHLADIITLMVSAEMPEAVRGALFGLLDSVQDIGALAFNLDGHQ